MGQSLIEIAQSLRDTNKKVQLIYAFNGTGKTRLSREFRLLVAPKDIEGGEDTEEEQGIKVLYYNAFTEDLFYWDNDLDDDSDRKLKIQPNGFTNWVLGEQGQDQNIIKTFQQLTNNKLTPLFNENYSEIRFSYKRGNDETSENVKISKGEESSFIWSVFYALIEQIVGILNVSELKERETDRYDCLEYIFIDDPVSSLDDTHLIELAVNIARLIKLSQSSLKFIITTHNPLFYNVLYNEFKKSEKYRLEKLEDGTYLLHNNQKDSPFSYHMFLLSELEKAIASGTIQKYHFNFLRNILEKTATFLGYEEWKELLPAEGDGSREGYYNRIINLSSHSKHHGEEISVIEENEKRVLAYLVQKLIEIYHFKSNAKSIKTNNPRN